MTATLLTTVSGKLVDLYAPQVETIDFDDIAEHLAKEPRYNGATPGRVYSVAEHLVLGCDWLLCDDETRDAWEMEGRPCEFGEDPPLAASPEQRLHAAYYLCHDFHEAYLKDDTTPKKRAADRIAHEFGQAAGSILDALGRQVERFDAAIHERAGLAWKKPDHIEAIVKEIDRRMLVTEWLQLRKAHALPPEFEGVEPLPIQIECHSWPYAKHLLLTRMEMLLPGARGSNERGF
jgi:hypothetical protein